MLIHLHSVASAMSTGIELDIEVRNGVANEEFIAVAIGNIASYNLSRERNEGLQWQVLQVDVNGHHHHYRLVLRHPEKTLDIGLKHALEKELTRLSSLDEEGLRSEYVKCEKDGLKPSRLKHVSDHHDTWNDDFWNWIG